MSLNPSRVHVRVTYNGVNVTRDLEEYLLDLSYTDAEPGEADDLTINLEDTALKWINTWKPKSGDRIVADIIPFDWDKAGDKQLLSCGSFEVDTLDFQGPPDVVSIKGTAIPVGKAGRLEKRSKAWEKVTLKSIAAEVAKRCGLKLMFQSTSNPTYDRQDQTDVTDVEFLNGLAKEEGLAMKISADHLILFDEKDYEDKAPLFTLNRKESGLLSYSFSESTHFVAYSSATISYTPPKPLAAKKANAAKKQAKGSGIVKPAAASPTPTAEPKAIKVTYTAPGAPKGGPVLRLNESVSSEAEALRAAKKALREKNKEATKASFEIVGNVKVVSGVTFMGEEFGKFDGKYIIISASHAVGGSGYKTQIEARKVLGW